jgi:hypothetical protein
VRVRGPKDLNLERRSRSEGNLGSPHKIDLGFFYALVLQNIKLGGRF